MEQQLAYTQHAGPVPPPPLPQAPPPGKKAVCNDNISFPFLNIPTITLPCSVYVSFFQVNGAPPSECGGGEEDAGASYVELGQGGQEVIMMVMMLIIVMVMMIIMYWSV